MTQVSNYEGQYSKDLNLALSSEIHIFQIKLPYTVWTAPWPSPGMILPTVPKRFPVSGRLSISFPFKFVHNIFISFCKTHDIFYLLLGGKDATRKQEIEGRPAPIPSTEQQNVLNSILQILDQLITVLQVLKLERSRKVIQFLE